MHCRPLAVKTICSGLGDQSVAGEKLRGDGSRRLRADRWSSLPQRDIERFGRSSPSRLLGDHRRLRRQHRIVEFQIDARAARLGRRGDAAARFAGNEGAASDFADHEAAAQQFGVDAARGRDGDLALIGKAALRRQAVAGLERAVGDLGGDGIGKLQIFEFRHYCTESNVFLAPIQLSDHLVTIKPEIALREAKAIRVHQGASAVASVCANGSGFAARKPMEKEDDDDIPTRRPASLPKPVGRICPRLGNWANAIATYLGAPRSDQSAASNWMIVNSATSASSAARSRRRSAAVVDPELGQHACEASAQSRLSGAA